MPPHARFQRQPADYAISFALMIRPQLDYAGRSSRRDFAIAPYAAAADYAAAITPALTPNEPCRHDFAAELMPSQADTAPLS